MKPSPGESLRDSDSTPGIILARAPLRTGPRLQRRPSEICARERGDMGDGGRAVAGAPRHNCRCPRRRRGVSDDGGERGERFDYRCDALARIGTAWRADLQKHAPSQGCVGGLQRVMLPSPWVQCYKRVPSRKVASFVGTPLPGAGRAFWGRVHRQRPPQSVL